MSWTRTRDARVEPPRPVARPQPDGWHEVYPLPGTSSKSAAWPYGNGRGCFKLACPALKRPSRTRERIGRVRPRRASARNQFHCLKRRPSSVLVDDSEFGRWAKSEPRVVRGLAQHHRPRKASRMTCVQSLANQRCGNAVPAIRLNHRDRRQAGADCSRGGRHRAEADVADDRAVRLGDQRDRQPTGAAQEVHQARFAGRGEACSVNRVDCLRIAGLFFSNRCQVRVCFHQMNFFLALGYDVNPFGVMNLAATIELSRSLSLSRTAVCGTQESAGLRSPNSPGPPRR